MRTRLFLFALCAMFLTACAGMTTGEVTAGIAAGAGAIAAIGQAISPYLPPEKAAEFVQMTTTAQTVVDAVAQGLGTVAQQIAQTKAELAQVDAHTWTAGEVAGLAVPSLGATAIATAKAVNKMRDAKYSNPAKAQST